MADDIEVMDDSGDAILVVGSKDPVQLKVSSSTLSRVSRVFKALFGPHFSRSTLILPRRRTGTAQLHPADDDQVAMTSLCCLLHCCDMPETKDNAARNEAPLLLDFAVAVDKYDVVGALRLQSQALLMSWVERVKVDFTTFGDVRSLGQLMAAAYLLGQPKAFGQLTLLWVDAKISRPSRLLVEQSGQIIPTKPKLVLITPKRPGRRACVSHASGPMPIFSTNATSTASSIKQLFENSELGLLRKERIQERTNACGLGTRSYLSTGIWRKPRPLAAVDSNAAFSRPTKISLLRNDVTLTPARSITESVRPSKRHRPYDSVQHHDLPEKLQNLQSWHSTTLKLATRLIFTGHPPPFKMANDVQVIDDEGDVVFVVGTSTSKKKLKLSSAILSRVSPVFQALLGPHFRKSFWSRTIISRLTATGEEQAARSATQTAEIALPNDDPTAMTRLLELLHLQDVGILIPCGGKNYSRKLLDFAVVADKVFVRSPNLNQSNGMLLTWLTNFAGEDNVSSQGNIIAASYLLDQPAVFEEITKKFMQAMHPTSSALLKELSASCLTSDDQCNGPTLFQLPCRSDARRPRRTRRLSSTPSAPSIATRIAVSETAKSVEKEKARRGLHFERASALRISHTHQSEPILNIRIIPHPKTTQSPLPLSSSPLLFFNSTSSPPTSSPHPPSPSEPTPHDPVSYDNAS
ncbi:uncharacterized protein MYCFIDRAFT_170157 [Pseudocercospora fijiensis CIRAD86]|uniref:BTB domain-containing protein n=1 Tax=Pseudocercospora fijiensis (strain CIRAD86) TaxID=383855 RepID=N1QBK9_PSEFD|nr:uncharacterized protein MYCFIDRAFT_170157 [Pseudocercospora fijiensis CIRAD86]EME88553.1 hypothetical protein MYCFIDRAFT_170157 [Pseudocercospora fijiensis CIRAD86]